VSEGAPTGWLLRVRKRAAAHEEKLRFLVVGGWNTVFSMAALWVLERLVPYGKGSVLGAAVGVVAAKQIVLTIAWVVGVTHNLFTFKLLVFRTTGRWLAEYLRMYGVYAATFVVQSLMVQAISAWLGWSLFASNVPTILVVMVLSYIGHKYFTFRRPEDVLSDEPPA
jgi:putative flippase GtrA